MTPDVLFVVMRILISIALYVFLGMVIYYVRRDIIMQEQTQQVLVSTSGKLVVIDSEDVPINIGEEFKLQPITTIGRGPTNSISLPDTFASTDHARISLRNGQWLLEDRNSRNGTVLNDVVISGVVVLSSGDEVSIGRVKFRFETGS